MESLEDDLLEQRESKRRVFWVLNHWYSFHLSQIQHFEIHHVNHLWFQQGLKSLVHHHFWIGNKGWEIQEAIRSKQYLASDLEWERTGTWNRERNIVSSYGQRPTPTCKTIKRLDRS
jgi:hypothetical protein